MNEKKTFKELQEQIKNAIPDDDGWIDLPVFLCQPAREEEPGLDEDKDKGGFVVSLVRKVKALFYF